MNIKVSSNIKLNLGRLQQLNCMLLVNKLSQNSHKGFDSPTQTKRLVLR